MLYTVLRLVLKFHPAEPKKTTNFDLGNSMCSTIVKKSQNVMNQFQIIFEVENKKISEWLKFLKAR